MRNLRIEIKIVLILTILLFVIGIFNILEKCKMVEFQEEISENITNEFALIQGYQEVYQQEILQEILEMKQNISSMQEPKDVISEISLSENQLISKSSEVESIQHKGNKFKVGEICEIPDISTSVKLFTDYRVYDLWYTPHYRLQKASYTDSQGLRRFNNDYIVALGSYYSVNIGDRFEVTLDNGKKFTVIFGDGKWDTDCDSKNMYTPVKDYNGNKAANLLEFIIDENVLDEKIYRYGDLNFLDNFTGEIVKIVYLGRDNSEDWNTYETK